MVLPLPGAWPGGLPCPWNRGTVDTVACRESTRGKRQSQRSRPWIKIAGCGRLRCRVGWWGACGWGSGMPGTVRPDPSTLGAVGERGSRRESCLQLVPGCWSQLEIRLPVEGEIDGGGVVAALGPGPLPSFGVDGLGGPDLAQQLLRAVLVEKHQQLFPGRQLERVDKPARPIAQQHGATEGLAGEGASEGLAGG